MNPPLLSYALCFSRWEEQKSSNRSLLNVLASTTENLPVYVFRKVLLTGGDGDATTPDGKMWTKLKARANDKGVFPKGVKLTVSQAPYPGMTVA